MILSVQHASRAERTLGAFLHVIFAMVREELGVVRVEYLLSGTTCQPTCDEGYIVSGKTSCDAADTLTAADCRELSCCERTFAKFGFGVAYRYDEL